jgi:hypothetical protein
MQIPDVNTLVYAHRPEMDHHAAARKWLEHTLTAQEPVLLTDIAISGFLRLVTNPRVFVEPMTLVDGVQAIEDILARVGVERGMSGPAHLSLLVDVAPAAVGDRVPDAYLAALAVEQDAMVVTWDRGFEQFRGVRWMTPGPR